MGKIILFVLFLLGLCGIVYVCLANSSRENKSFDDYESQ